MSTPEQTNDSPNTTAEPNPTANEAVPTTDTTSDGGDEQTKANKEAAKYRTRLREAEAERDGLTARVETMQRAEVARLAGSALAVGADVFDIGGADLADLLTEAGDIDPERVSAVAADLAEQRPGLALRRFTGTADAGPRPTSAAEAPRMGGIFSDQ